MWTSIRSTTKYNLLACSRVSLQTSLYNWDTFQDLETVKWTRHLSPDLLKSICSPDRFPAKSHKASKCIRLCRALKAVPVSHVSDDKPKQVIIANRESSSDTSESPEMEDGGEATSLTEKQKETAAVGRKFLSSSTNKQATKTLQLLDTEKYNAENKYMFSTIKTR